MPVVLGHPTESLITKIKDNILGYPVSVVSGLWQDRFWFT